MKTKFLAAAAVVLALQTPAIAQNQTTTPAALEQIQLAATLARYGEARQDPILMLAAAKIAREVSNESAPASDALPTLEDMLSGALAYSDGDATIASEVEGLRSAQPKAYCYGPYGVGWC